LRGPQTSTRLSCAFPTLSFTGKGADAYSQTNDCGSTLAAATCTLEVTFLPTQLGVRFDAILNLAESSSIKNQVSLSGYSTPTNATLSPSSLNFPNTTIGTSSSLPATLTNSGLETLAISSIHIYGVFTETNNCGANLASGASCTIQVEFTPTSAVTYSNHLYLYDDAGNGTQSIPVSGMGVE
jgi:centrosomal CEP192-like protein